MTYPAYNQHGPLFINQSPPYTVVDSEVTPHYGFRCLYVLPVALARAGVKTELARSF